MQMRDFSAFNRSDYDMSLHTNPDARAWAKSYVETRIISGKRKIPASALEAPFVWRALPSPP